ncbi:MAG: YHS domain protein [Yoonia sp.]|uniref:YHS domain-containing (seleno)protein n=1 Tax=Yoonia sp. TaxID=2212373 RepID=UPI00273F7700|nr:YHS domain-containing (seleno)protein [Yoonia sp.]MDP5086178.1 YHS domain protein [Yoonia sp.]
MIDRRRLLGCLVATPLAASPAFAGCPSVSSESGQAIGGFDPVGYFRDGQAVAGSDAHRLMWRNVVWRFASEQNLAVFERDPVGFSPQFGGYCAVMMSEGRVIEGSPEAWAIYDDKLYFTRSLAARDLWLQDPAPLIVKADSHWPAALCR